MPIETVRFTITGANPQIKDIQVTVDETGHASGSLQYQGVNGGNDTIQATMVASNGRNYTSNPSSVAWQPTNGPLAVGPVVSNFYAGGTLYTGTGGFLGGPHTGNSLVYNSPINGFPMPGFVEPRAANQQTPMQQLQQTANGQWSSNITFSEANLGPGFHGNYQGSFVIANPGTYTFYFLVDDSWIFWINGATRVSGPLTGTATPKASNMTLMGSRITGAAGVEPVDKVVVTFPAAGVYPFEVGHGEQTGNGYLVCTYTPGNGPTPTIPGGQYGADIKPVSIILPTPAVGVVGNGNLKLTPTGGASNLLVQGATVTLSLDVSGVTYQTKPYIPLLEGHAGHLYLYNNPDAATFDFQTYNSVVPNPAIAVGSLSYTADNGVPQGRLSIKYNGSKFVLDYNGAAFSPNVEKSLLTITAQDIPWYAGGIFDLFGPTSQGGGGSLNIEVDYLFNATVGSVTPLAVSGDGANHSFTINLSKPLSPLQQTTTTCTVSFTGGLTLVNTTPIVVNGWITGYTVTATAGVFLNPATSIMHVQITGNITYLKVDVFVTEVVTYYNADAAVIQINGVTNLAPSNVVFGVISDGLNAVSNGIGVSTTLSCTVRAGANVFGNVQFYRQVHGSGVRTALGAPVTPTNIRQSNGFWFADYGATVNTSTLYDNDTYDLGYAVTNTDNQSLTYWDPTIFLSNNSAPSGGGGGGCPAVEMYVAAGRQVRDVLTGHMLDCLVEERDIALHNPDWTPLVDQHPVEWIVFGVEECILFRTENGAEIIVSDSTPIMTREALDMAALGVPEESIPALASVIRAGMHVVTDVGNGPEWSRLEETCSVGLKLVARLYVGGKNFAAGSDPTKRIFTHNNVAAPTEVK